MRGRQLSYRLRRRLVGLVLLAALAGGVTAASLLLPRGEKLDRGPTDQPSASALASSRQGTSRIHLTRADREGIKYTISLFVRTAVARHHPERSWPIVAPVLREGMTRRQWGTGNIPVVPYPAVGVDLLNVQSLESRSAQIEVVLRPVSTSKLVRKTFQIELRRLPRAQHGWAVSAWVPEGVSESQLARESRDTPPSVVAAAYNATHFPSEWIFIPLGVLLGGLVLIPGGLFVHEAYRFRRAEAEYRTSLADKGELRR